MNFDGFQTLSQLTENQSNKKMLAHVGNFSRSVFFQLLTCSVIRSVFCRLEFIHRKISAREFSAGCFLFIHPLPLLSSVEEKNGKERGKKTIRSNRFPSTQKRIRVKRNFIFNIHKK